MKQYKEYKEYKDSGIEWIGKIPKEWEVKKVKYLANLFNGNSLSDDKKEEYSKNDVGYKYISTKDININTMEANYDVEMSIPFDDIEYKIAPKNSILLCIEGGSAGKKIAFNIHDVAFVNKLCCFIPKHNTNIKFFYYVISSQIFYNQFNISISGLIGGVSITLINSFSAIIPTSLEQQKIANYLDDKTAKIDEIVADKLKMIELLKEKRQAVISETVTKGLDKSAPMKDSGIEWIGKIPKHWGVKKLKYTSKLYPKCNLSNIDDNCEVSFTPMECIKRGSIELRTEMFEKYNSSYNLFENNDILLAKVTPCFENMNIAIASGLTNNIGFGSSELFIFRATSCINKFMFYLFQSNYFLEIGKSSMNGVAGLKRVNSDYILNTDMPFPPLGEQEAIANYLDNYTAKVDNTISDIEAQIEKLKEYRQSIISEVVTGKVKI